MKHNLDNIVIVGGGTAGWLSALYLNNKFKNSKITLIESNEIGILGAGEGTTGNIVKFLNDLGISQDDMLNNCEATFKTGIDFENWTNNRSTYYHPIDYKPKGQGYAYHFNARLLAKYLKALAIERGVNWIEGIVTEPIVDDTNKIIGLKTADSIIDATFVIDCSGFKRLLIGNHYKSKWISYEKHLKVNTAIPFFLPNDNVNIRTTTKSIAMKFGWMWQIPLQSRRGCGYIFDSTEISEEEAKKEIIEFLGVDVEFNKPIKFKPGSYENVWVENCLAIGLSGGFLEPLEATSIMTTILQLEVFCEVISEKITLKKYNKFVNCVNTENMVFIYYHYLTNRTDTNFWKKVKESASELPSPLDLIIDSSYNFNPKKELTDIFLDDASITFGRFSYDIINKGIKQKQKSLI
jgi:tryptophan halogenase